MATSRSSPYRFTVKLCRGRRQEKFNAIQVILFKKTRCKKLPMDMLGSCMIDLSTMKNKDDLFYRSALRLQGNCPELAFALKANMYWLNLLNFKTSSYRYGHAFDTAMRFRNIFPECGDMLAQALYGTTDPD